MKAQKTLHIGMKNGVKSAYRSVSSTFKKYFGVVAVGTALSLAPMLPSLAHGQGNITTVIEQLKEMKIGDLKKHIENWKKERGDKKQYNGVTEFKDKFVVDVSVIGKSIQLKNGKRVRVGSTIYYENFDKEKGAGTGTSSVFVEVLDGINSVGAWMVPLAELQLAYKEMTGNDLKYVHVIVNHDKNHEKLGEMVGVIVIAADSLKEVKNGNIKTGMPGIAFPYVADENTVYSGGGTPNIITACVKPDVLDGEVVAKK